MNEDQEKKRAQVAEFLLGRGVPSRCQCGANSWAMSMNDDEMMLMLSPMKAMPAYIMTCSGCGFTRIYSRNIIDNALKQLKRDES